MKSMKTPRCAAAPARCAVVLIEAASGTRSNQPRSLPLGRLHWRWEIARQPTCSNHRLASSLSRLVCQGTPAFQLDSPRSLYPFPNLAFWPSSVRKHALIYHSTLTSLPYAPDLVASTCGSKGAVNTSSPGSLVQRANTHSPLPPILCLIRDTEACHRIPLSVFYLRQN